MFGRHPIGKKFRKVALGTRPSIIERWSRLHHRRERAADLWKHAAINGRQQLMHRTLRALLNPVKTHWPCLFLYARNMVSSMSFSAQRLSYFFFLRQGRHWYCKQLPRSSTPIGANYTGSNHCLVKEFKKELGVDTILANVPISTCSALSWPFCLCFTKSFFA